MAGKNVEGQLELFSLFDSVEELEFDSTKEAVGYYADWLDRHASDEAAVAAQRPEALQKAKAVRWENTEVEK